MRGLRSRAPGRAARGVLGEVPGEAVEETARDDPPGPRDREVRAHLEAAMRLLAKDDRMEGSP